MKKLLLGAAVLTLAFAFAGCGSTDATTENPTGGSENPTEVTSVVEGETVEASTEDASEDATATADADADATVETTTEAVTE